MNTELSAETVVKAPTAEVCYDRRTVRLHWVTAVLMSVLWGIAQIIDLFPKGAPKIAARSVHIILGLVLGILLVMRIAWRCRSGRKLPPANRGFPGYLARTVHLTLYAGLAAVIVLGVVNAWARGDSIFSLFHIPKLFPATQLKPTMEYLHKTFANALLILAAAHAAAAVVHHFILRDEVLRRMLREPTSEQTRARRFFGA